MSSSIERATLSNLKCIENFHTLPLDHFYINEADQPSIFNNYDI